MMTEVFGFLIIIGAILAFAFREQLRSGGKPRPKVDEGTFAVSAYRLRSEMEQSGNEIIARMDEHIDRLEKLIVEADKRTAMLDARIREMKRMAAQMEERTDAVEFSQMLHHSMAVADGTAGIRAGAIRLPEAMPQQVQKTAEQIPVREESAHKDSLQMQSKSSIGKTQVQIPEKPSASHEDEEMTAGSDAKQVQEVMEGLDGEIAEDAVSDNVWQEESFAGQDQGTVSIARKKERSSKNPSMRKAKDLLEEGRSDEEIARKTNLGQNAIELMRQMRKKNDG